MVDDDALDDGIVGFSLREGKPQLAARQRSRDLAALEIDAVLLDVDLDELFVGGVATARLADHVEVLPDHLAADLNVEHSFARIAEVHLNCPANTYANLRMRVVFPCLTGRE